MAYLLLIFALLPVEVSYRMNRVRSGIKTGQLLILLHEGSLDGKVAEPSSDLICHPV